jgi:hypothetical protein
MASVQVRFILDFSQEQDFPGAILSQLTTWGKPDFLSENAHQCGKRILLEQSSPDYILRWSSFTVPLCKWCSQRSFSGVLEPCWSNLLCGKSCSFRYLGLKRSWKDAIFKKFKVKTNFQLKLNVAWKYLKSQIYPTKTSVSLSNLVRLSL